MTQSDGWVKELAKNQEYGELACYFFNILMAGSPKDKKIANRQFDKVLSKKVRDIVNVS